MLMMLANPSTGNFNFPQFLSIGQVFSTLRNLKPSKATGFDKIRPAKILKLSANIIAPSLTFIFNLSLATVRLKMGMRSAECGKR